jgi:hypothetical protein
VSNKIAELFGIEAGRDVDWQDTATRQWWPYLARKCVKTHKSQPGISIGTCTVQYGKRRPETIVICPHRFLDRGQVFQDCTHLLTLHEPGNELHVVSEVTIPGGSVDYFLVSARRREAVDFVGIELQTLDTTGNVWPERQRFLQGKGVRVRRADAASKKQFGMNKKMTAKTILVQLHHKVKSFEGIGKHLALVVQDVLLASMRKSFHFDRLQPARLGDSMHIHAYSLLASPSGFQLELSERASTDADGVAACLGLRVSARIEVVSILEKLSSRLSDSTLLSIPTKS